MPLLLPHLQSSDNALPMQSPPTGLSPLAEKAAWLTPTMVLLRGMPSAAPHTLPVLATSVKHATGDEWAEAEDESDGKGEAEGDGGAEAEGKGDGGAEAKGDEGAEAGGEDSAAISMRTVGMPLPPPQLPSPQSKPPPYVTRPQATRAVASRAACAVASSPSFMRKGLRMAPAGEHSTWLRLARICTVQALG